MGPTIYLNAESFARGGVITGEGPNADVIPGGDVEVPTLRHHEGRMTVHYGEGLASPLALKRVMRKLRRQLRASKRAQRLDHRETDYGRAILAGLQSKHVYQGTAADQRGGRRAANRRAKASRKANRG